MKTLIIKKNKQQGFSAVEILIAIFILSLIIVAVVSFQIDIFSLNKSSGDNLNIQEDLRRTLKTLSAEIRSMSPSNMGAYPIIQAGTSTLVFYDNIDNDTLVEKVRYFLVGTTLKKGVIKPTGSPLTYNSANETFKELAHNVANATTSIFSYYDSSYDGNSSPLTQPVDSSLVRLIKAEIIIDENPTKAPPPISLTTQVSIRNIKDNL